MPARSGAPERRPWWRQVHSGRTCCLPRQPVPEDLSTPLASIPRELREADLLRAAFRDLHGSSLHGFALLVTAGDRRRAERVASAALSRGARRAEALRHPERAAAWLRLQVLRQLSRAHLPGRARRQDREAVLRSLGATPSAIAGLRALSVSERAALVAASVERFVPADVETILGRSAGGARRSVAAARRRYLQVVAPASARLAGVEPDGDGLLARRVAEVATRTLKPTGGAHRT